MGNTTNNPASAVVPTNPNSTPVQGLDVNSGESPGTQYLNSVTNLTTGQGVNQTNTGTGQLSTATGGLQQVLDYYGNILSGDRSSISSALAPEVDNIGSQFQNIRQMLAQGGARGGGTASALATLPQQQTSQITNLISGAQNNAAQGEAQASGTLGQLAEGEQGLGEGETQNSIANELAAMGIATTKTGQDFGFANGLISNLV